MPLGPVMLGLDSLELSAEERELLIHPLVGGVILFSRNYQSVAQITSLITAIHALRQPPLLIAVDHEGGRVQRFREGFTILPPARRLGEIFNHNPSEAKKLAHNCGSLLASELRAVGIDFSFAPVLDLDHGCCPAIGDRALDFRSLELDRHGLRFTEVKEREAEHLRELAARAHEKRRRADGAEHCRVCRR